jgi:hypothetical protein
MSEFNLSEKVRLAEHNAYGDKVIPLEDVKEFIKLVTERIECFDHLCINSGALNELIEDIDKLAGDLK